MKRATIEDVAQAAGVSRQTVSRAMNDKNEISQETKERVMRAVQELGYRPNRMAQSMVTQRTHAVGMVMADITNPFFPEVTRGVQDIAQASGYNVFVCNTDDRADLELQELRSLAAQGVDGIIVFSHNASDEEIRAFADTYKPMVFVNREFEHPNASVIMVDNFHGAYLAVEHLVARRTQIGMLTNNSPTYSTSRRLMGFKQALTDHGLPFEEGRVIPEAANLDGGYRAAHQLLDKYPEINAIFTYNDLMAMGALRASQERGRQVPGDIALIGFDDIQFARMITPSLTTIRVDKYAIGQIAMHRLMDMINNPEDDFPLLRLDPELIIRETA
ncbi:MAG TPA: LacI family DNA-binding transcriptional regulator [Anaerolineales bacterium]|nr:LacI family DNA-binding transcriptional regulator [Anaerolineales bacterium]